MTVQTHGSWFEVLGVPVSKLDLEQAAERIEEWSNDCIGRFVCIRDVASLMAIVKDKDAAALHEDAAMITPDGMPLVAIGKLKGHRVSRVCGPDLIEVMMARSAVRGTKHYFYGGKEGVAAKMAQRFRGRYPSAQIVGFESPPFEEMSEAERRETLDRLRASGADVVWVGMSSPKQDLWMWKNHKALPQTLIGVGAAFDFHSGEVARAPRWMQRSGLEWAHRLRQEPRRLWRRYLLQAPRFVLAVLRSEFARKRKQ